MTEQTAKIVIVAGGFVGLLVWLVALAFYRRMAAAEETEYFEQEFPGRSPEEVIAAIVDQVKRYANMAKFSRPSPTSFSIHQFGVQAHFAAERAGGAPTRLVAGLDDAQLRRKFLAGMGLLVLVVMPAVIGGLCVGLWIWVAPSPQQNIRWQAVQIVQMVHVLWPPFLVYFIWQSMRKRASMTISNMLVLLQSDG